MESDFPIKINWFFNNQPIKPGYGKNIEIYRECGVFSIEKISTFVSQNRCIKFIAKNLFGSDEASCGFIKTLKNQELSQIDGELVY